MHEAHANGPSPSSHMHELKTCTLATKTYKKYYNLIFLLLFSKYFSKIQKNKIFNAFYHSHAHFKISLVDIFLKK